MNGRPCRLQVDVWNENVTKRNLGAFGGRRQFSGGGLRHELLGSSTEREPTRQPCGIARAIPLARIVPARFPLARLVSVWSPPIPGGKHPLQFLLDHPARPRDRQLRRALPLAPTSDSLGRVPRTRPILLRNRPRAGSDHQITGRPTGFLVFFGGLELNGRGVRFRGERQFALSPTVGGAAEPRIKRPRRWYFLGAPWAPFRRRETPILRRPIG